MSRGYPPEMRAKLEKLGYHGIIRKYGSYPKAAQALGICDNTLYACVPRVDGWKRRAGKPDHGEYSSEYPDLPPGAARCLVAIKKLFDKGAGQPPTMRDIAAAIGVSSTNGVMDHLKVLERQGYVARPDKRFRSRRLRLTEKAGATPEVPREAICTLVLHAQATAEKGSMLEWAWDKVDAWLEKTKPCS